ncbi:host attachment protein [Candidatus Giovannonibacteria bacterium]|nr:host attachment protein [Candidatus Giovannonibacteria bacterium]
MKIPQDLPQFADKKTLFIVTSGQAGLLFELFSGKLAKIAEFKEDPVVYSDREGFFMRSGHGMVMSTGSVYESKKFMAENRFLKMLHKEVKRAMEKGNYEDVYLFASPHRMKATKAALPRVAEKAIKALFRGNYIHTNPLNLVEKIGELKTRLPEDEIEMLTREDAKKILDESKQARDVMGK